MLSINADILRQLAPQQGGRRGARQNEIIEGMGASIAATLDRYSINTPLRIAHFLGQIAHESDGFCTTEEYASGDAYENRADLGNVHKGDGKLFKGRGLIQLTGRGNYRAVGKELGIDLMGVPLSVNDPVVYLLVSCVFWTQKKINRHCDDDDIITVTHLVNGGSNGLDSRKAYLAKAKALIAPLLAGMALPPGGGLAVLHRGSQGDAVASLQRRLAAAGYKLALDGDFSAATELAVTHFQSACGLAADGIVGTQTWTAIQNRAAAK